MRDDPTVDEVVDFVMFNMYLLGGWMRATAEEFEDSDEVMKALVKDSIEAFYKGAESYAKHDENIDETPLSTLAKVVNNRIPKEKK
jgi:hypothetical protein